MEMEKAMFRRFGLMVAAAALAVLMASSVQAGIIVLKQTGMNGGQTQLDVNHSYYWRFTTLNAGPYDPIAKFTMKVGPKTTEDAVLELWTADGSFINQALVGVYRMAPSELGQNKQSFAERTFVLGVPPTGTTPVTGYTFNGNYNLIFKSSAIDAQAKAWFIKGDLGSSSLVFQDSNGNQQSGFTFGGMGDGNGTTPDSPTTQAPVPEPASLTLWGLLAVGALVRGKGYWKRRQVAAVR